MSRLSTAPNEKKRTRFAEFRQKSLRKDSGDDDDDSNDTDSVDSIIHSSGVGRSSSGLCAKNLHSHLMREQLNRDPLFYYDVVAVLGVGSMGSVVRVRKRDNVVGGSARKEVQDAVRKDKMLNECFAMPIIGCLLKNCLPSSFGPRMPTKNIKENLLESINDNNIQFDHRHQQHHNQNFTTNSNSYRGNMDSITLKDGRKHDYQYAMKSIHLGRILDPVFIQELKNEIEILKCIDHPNVVRPMETFELRDQIFIVMELCSGGDLYTRDPYTEPEAARILSAILSAISYMHSKNIAHRDLKYENIIFIDDSPSSVVKLIDFGLSKAYGENINKPLTENVGTIYTMAPEVLKGKYTNGADLWSVGVIAYMLLSSQMPFFGRKRRHIVELILKGKYKFNGNRWKYISKQAKNFVKDLLVKDPDERLTADEAYASNWIHQRQMMSMRNVSMQHLQDANQSIMKYAAYSKLQKLAMMLVAHKSTSEDIGILRKVFQSYDTHGHGEISFEEFKEALDKFGYSIDQLHYIFEQVDINGSGMIRYTEFLAATIESRGTVHEEQLAEAFDRIDSDDSGYITRANLIEILGDDFPLEEIDSILSECKANNRGRITYREFLALWEKDRKKEKRNSKTFRRMGSNATVESSTVQSMQSMRSTDTFDDDSSFDTSNDDLIDFTSEGTDYGTNGSNKKKRRPCGSIAFNKEQKKSVSKFEFEQQQTNIPPPTADEVKEILYFDSSPPVPPPPATANSSIDNNKVSGAESLDNIEEFQNEYGEAENEKSAKKKLSSEEIQDVTKKGTTALKRQISI